MKNKLFFLITLLFTFALVIISTTGTMAVKELTVWGWDFRATKDIAPQIEQFEKEHPDVKIKTLNMAGDDLHDKFYIATVSGQGAPDITFNTTDQTGKYYKLGNKAILPLNDVMPNYENEYFDSLIPEYTYNDKLWAAPYDTGPTVLFYRNDIFKREGIEFPTNWQEFVEVGKKITTEDRYMTVIDNTSADFLISMLQSRGGKFSDNDGNPQFYNETMIEICQYVVDLVNKHEIAEYASPWDSAAWQKIKQGRWAVIPNWFWYQSFGLKDMAYSPELDGKWRMEPILPWTENDPATGANFVSSGVWLVSSQTEYPELAKEFVAYISSEKAQVNQSNNRGIFPANKLAVENLSEKEDPFFGGQKTFEIGLKTLENAPQMYLGENRALFSDVLINALDKMILQDVPVKKALEEAQNQAELELRD